jgi:predicted NBD/HSP70 family sugar kinase
MALANAWFGAGRNAGTLALLLAGHVVGCALVSGRRAHRGLAASAGGIGQLPHWAPDSHQPGRPAGPAATLDDLVSTNALRREARLLAAQHPESMVAQWLAKGETERGAVGGAVAAILRHASDLSTDDPADPDAPAIALLRRRAAALAPYVAQVIALYAPHVFVVTGSFARDPALFQLKLLREAVRNFAPALEEHLPPFVPSAFGADTTVVGAGALVLQAVYSPPLADGGAGADATVRSRLLTRAPEVA